MDARSLPPLPRSATGAPTDRRSRSMLSLGLALAAPFILSSALRADLVGSQFTLTQISHTRTGDVQHTAVVQEDPTGNGPVTILSGSIPGMMVKTITQTVNVGTPQVGDVVTFCLMPTSMHSGAIPRNATSMDLIVTGFTDHHVDGTAVAPQNIGVAQFNGDFGLGKRNHHVRLNAPSSSFSFANTAPDASGAFSAQFHLSLPRGAGMLACTSHLDFSMAVSGGPQSSPQVIGSSSGSQNGTPPPSGSSVAPGETIPTPGPSPTPVPEPASLVLALSGLSAFGWIGRRRWFPQTPAFLAA